MSATRTMEARLVIAGEDRGASAAIDKVVKAVRQMEDANKVSKPLQDLTKGLHQVEQASRAVDAAMKAGAGMTQAEAGLKSARDAAAATARALDEARRARAAYDGVKATKGSDQALQIEAATKAVRAAGEAHRKAEGDVRKATAAVSAQTATLGHAERAVVALGGDLKNLEAHQVKLRQVYDATTEAMVRQVRAEEQASRVGATMGSVGRVQLERIEQSRRLTEGMSAQARAARELADQEARLVRIEHDRKRASAGRDLSAGMGSAGRRTLDDLEGGRRVASGMGASAREARAAAEASAAAAAARTKDQRAARDVAAGVVGVAASSALEGAYVKARDGWIEMDEATRRQKAVLGITDEQQKPLNAQALKIGQDTRFSNPDVIKAQTRIGASLPDHVKTPGVIAAITENAKDYALAMGTTMDEAADLVKGRMLALRMDISTPEATAASAKHATNRLVQLAKSSGSDHNDLVHYTKFGAAPGRVGGFSEEFSDAMAAQLRRIGYEGAMAGNFVRSAATRLAVPTSKGLGVLAAAGLNHSGYVAPGKELSSDNLNSALKLKFGKGLTNSQLARIQDLMNDEDVVGNKEEFVPRVSAIVQETLAKRTKKGRVNANDAERIAKSVNEYHTAAAGAVDIERLMRDVIAKGITPAMAKYLFGSEHGGRAQSLDLGTLNKDVETFRNTPENRAQKIGEDVNAGSYGAYQRMIGSFETFWMRLGQVNDGPLTKFYDGLGNAVDVISRFPDGFIQAGTVLGGLAGAAIAGRGALGVYRVGRDLLGFGGGAAALSGSAAALTTSASLLDAAAIKLAAGLPGAVPAAATPAAAAAPSAAAVFGLGGITIAGGAIGGAYLDSSQATQGGMGVAAVTGEETTGQRLIRENHEMLERQKTLEGQAEELTQRLETERGVHQRLKAAQDRGVDVTAPLAESGKRIARWEEEVTALDARIKVLSSMPLPPPRPPDFTEFKTKAGEAGTEAGTKAGEGIRTGIETKAPEVEEQGRSLFQRLKDVFSQGILIPMSFAPGEGMGRAGGAGVQTASFGGDGNGGGRLDSLIHRASLSGNGGFTAGPGGGVASARGGGGAGYGGSVAVSPDGGGEVRRHHGHGGLDLVAGDADPAIIDYIRSKAAALGIDPDVANTVANREALRAFNPNRPDKGGDQGTSFGPFQLHYGGGTGANRQKGLGDVFTKMTGLDARDPDTWRQQVDFALNYARRHGWGSWYGARNYGIGAWAGIGGHASHGDASGLRVKGGLGGQAFGGGHTDPALIGLAEQLQKGGGVDRFTAFNDRYHKGRRSQHARGLAMDLTGDPRRIIPNARTLMEAQGLVEGRDYRIIDEYAHPSRRSTGGHVHIEFRNRKAADAYGAGMPKRAEPDRLVPADGERLRRDEPVPERAGLTIPERPEGGFGGGGRRDIGSAAERMHQAVDRMEGMGFDGQIQLAVTGSGRSQVRATGLKVRGRGGMSADMGMTMPGAKEDMGDWV